MRLPLLCLLTAILLAPLHAAEPPPQGERQKAKGEGAPTDETPLSPSALRPSPFFRPGDVIALVGGEDMVVASEYGYLELLLTRALPDHHLRFRNLAWEGDTVFEQRRDLGFPTWEEQLDKIGATVVIAQFGQMESLAGKEKLPEFIAAYEKLIERFSGGGKRRVILIGPSAPWQMVEGRLTVAPRIGALEMRLVQLVETLPARFLPTDGAMLQNDNLIRCFGTSEGAVEYQQEREAVIRSVHTSSGHLSQIGHEFAAVNLRQVLAHGPDIHVKDEENRELLALIIAKNRLWFDYWRPQNWAFLAGDRTAQPSSRDHLDPSKRWFPPEREAFLPLLDAKEKEIDALAAQLAQPEQ